MRLRLVAAAFYAALSVVFVIQWETEPAWLEDVDDTAIEYGFLVALFAVHPIAGFLIPRLWALALPYVAFVVSLPFSEADPELQGVTDAGAMLFGGFIAMILMAFGIGCRLTVEMLLEPR